MLLSIGFGGFIGSILRYLCSVLFSKITISVFPMGTLCVNVLGCLIIGLLINNPSMQSSNFPINEFIIIGILGGFTTFSAFGLETYNLINNGFMQIAILYIFLSIILGLIAIYISSNFNSNF